MNTIFLIRHATPEWIRPDPEYQKPPGPPLSQQGLQEAQALGTFLKEAGIQMIYTSPLMRCLQSAQIVAEITGALMKILEGLSEQLPEEKRAHVLQRLRPVLQEAIRSSRETGPVALFTHGSPIVYLLSELCMPDGEIKELRHYDYQNPLPPAGAMRASRATGDEGWKFELVYIPNQVAK